MWVTLLCIFWADVGYPIIHLLGRCNSLGSSINSDRPVVPKGRGGALRDGRSVGLFLEGTRPIPDINGISLSYP